MQANKHRTSELQVRAELVDDELDFEGTRPFQEHTEDLEICDCNRT